MSQDTRDEAAEDNAHAPIEGLGIAVAEDNDEGSQKKNNGEVDGDDQFIEEIGVTRREWEEFEEVAVRSHHTAESSQEVDRPACDGCRKEEGGTLICAGCQYAIYCSSRCQRQAWKAGHKNECSKLKEECEQYGREIVALLRDSSIPFVRRVMSINCGPLRRSGTYKAALSEGFNDAIRELLQEENDSIMERFRHSEGLISFSQTVMVELFRGQRFEDNSFTYVDSVRIKKYVLSHPDALYVWIDSLKQVVRAALDREVFMRQEGQQIHSMAAEAVSGWSRVFISTKAARAILMGESKEANAAVVARVKTIAGKFKKIMRCISNAPKERDRNQLLSGRIDLVVAIADARLREFDINVSFVNLIGAKSFKDEYYTKFAIPYAKHAIAKGALLTQDEGADLIRQSLNA